MADQKQKSPEEEELDRYLAESKYRHMQAPIAPTTMQFRPDPTSAGLPWPLNQAADLAMAEQQQQYGDAYEAAKAANAAKLEEVMRGIEQRKMMSRAFDPNPQNWPILDSQLAKR